MPESLHKVSWHLIVAETNRISWVGGGAGPGTRSTLHFSEKETDGQSGLVQWLLGWTSHSWITGKAVWLIQSLIVG